MTTEFSIAKTAAAVASTTAGEGMFLDLTVASDSIMSARLPLDMVRNAASGAFVWKDEFGFGIGYSDPGYSDCVLPPYRWQTINAAMIDAERLRAFMFGEDAVSATLRQ